MFGPPRLGFAEAEGYLALFFYGLEMEPKALLMKGLGLDGDGAQSSFNEWTWAYGLGFDGGGGPKALLMKGLGLDGGGGSKAFF